MARIFKEEEYATRRNEILDAALRLLYTKGYEQMTIQDIQHGLNISKGAFYHYFKSKQDLLEAIIERMMNEAVAVLEPIIDASHLSALEKLQCYFDTAGKWKTERKDLMLEILRTWYADDNALVRQKIFSSGAQWIGPALGKIVRQGIHEGVFDTPFPDQIGEILVSMFYHMGDLFMGALLNHTVPITELRHDIDAYTLAFERVLGAAEGSLVLVDDETLMKWVTDPPAS